MDTYFTVNSNCVKCGRCVRACKEESEYKCLVGGRDRIPDVWWDNIPCHWCIRDFEGKAPCLVNCYYNAINITRS